MYLHLHLYFILYHIYFFTFSLLFFFLSNFKLILKLFVFFYFFSSLLFYYKKAAEVASRIVKPGGTNTKVTEIMKKVAESYGVQFISGTLMHQMKRYVIDGNKMILLREETENKVETCTFEPNEVRLVFILLVLFFNSYSFFFLFYIVCFYVQYIF